MTTFLVSSQSQLVSSIAKADGGDSIVLAKGFTSNMIAIDGFNKSGGLTITSEDHDALASVACLKITNSSGITVRGLDVAQRPNASQTATVLNSRDIVLDRVHVHGVEDLSKTSWGMTIRYSSNVSVTNSEFDHLTSGIHYFNNDNVTLQGNKVSYIVNDGFIGSATSNLVIKDNYFTNFQHTGPVHPDCIQLYTKPGDTPAHDILITGNVYNRGNGTPVQGIWIRNDTGLAPFENVTVSNNTIIGSAYQGIGITAVGSLVLTGNRVQSYDDQLAKIWVNDTRGSVVAQNNVSTWFYHDGDKATFTGNAVTSTISQAGAQSISAAIAALASNGFSGLSTAAQNYLAGVSPALAVSDWSGHGKSFSLPVVGHARDFLDHPEIPRPGGGLIVGDNVLTATETNALKYLGTLKLADGASLTVRGSVSDLSGKIGYNAVHYALATGIEITGNNTINTAQATAIAGWNHVTLGENASIAVCDWGTNVLKTLDSLENLVSHGVVTSISMLDRVPVLKVGDATYTAYGDVFAAISNPVKEIVTVAAGHSVTAHDGAATLDGSLGNATLAASDAGNVLIGGAGDSLIGGHGQDTYIFHGHFGQVTIAGFDASDVVKFDRAAVQDYPHLQAWMHDVGHDVVIDLGAGDLLTLANTSVADLNAANFGFL
jgi:hypothetical protein